MAITTTNYNLKKPDQEDFYNIEDFNDNMDIIDAELKAKAEKGDTGDTGPAGATGQDGASAYEVAVENGYTGTETAWLASLIGADGADGTNGVDGADGTLVPIATASTVGTVMIGDGLTIDDDGNLTINFQTKSVTPTKAGFTVSADSGYVLNNVVVAGNTNLVAAKIKSGVTIFGVTGTYSGSAPTVSTFTKTFAGTSGTGFTGTSVCTYGIPTYCRIDGATNYSCSATITVYVGGVSVGTASGTVGKGYTLECYIQPSKLGAVTCTLSCSTTASSGTYMHTLSIGYVDCTAY